MAKEEKNTVSNPHGEKMVEIELFKDNDKYKDDVYVARNGESYLIKRGEKVVVPEGIAQIVLQSIAEDKKTAKKIEAEINKAILKAKEV